MSEIANGFAAMLVMNIELVIAVAVNAVHMS